MRKPVQLVRTALLGVTLTTLLAIGVSAAPLGAGTVTADALRLRDNPTTQSDILATAAAGDQVVVLEAAADGWYKVSYDTVEGYMSGDYLTVAAQSDVELGYGLVSTDGSPLNLRAWSGTEYDTLASIPGGSVLKLQGISDGWYKVTYAGQSGYVSSDYITLTTKSEETTSVSDNLGNQIVAYAKQFLGVPYVWGGNGPNCFDCSGFAKYVYAHFGYTLNRTATSQLQNGVAVSKNQLQPGDLVFFKHNTSKPVSHVGIYIGNGQFIHASTNHYAVQISDLSSGYYANIFVYARRIIG